MSEKIITAKMQKDGSLAQVMPNGGLRPLSDPTDDARLAAMTEDEITAAALADPGAQSFIMKDIASGKIKRVPQIKVIRRVLGMTQEEFPRCFHIP